MKNRQVKNDIAMVRRGVLDRYREIQISSKRGGQIVRRFARSTLGKKS